MARLPCTGCFSVISIPFVDLMIFCKTDSFRMDSIEKTQAFSDKDQFETSSLEQHSMAITDLNDDCLMSIFEHLDLRNLINVAASIKCLRKAARSVYSIKFGGKIVAIDVSINSAVSGILAPIQIEPWIKIHDFRTCLQYLRSFGPLISELRIGYYHYIKLYGYVEQYINRYCVESLVSISFFHKPQFFRENFRNPFINVRKVHISRANLNNQLPLFAEWFPNVQCLKLCDVQVDHPFNEATFHHLKHLSIEIYSLYPPDYSRESVADLLRMNPQLTSLTINIPFIKLTALLNILSNNKSISKLVVPTGSYSVGVDTAELIQLAREHPTLVKLDLQQFRFLADDVILLIHRLRSLQMFRFILVNNAEYGHLIGRLDPEWKSTASQEWYETIRYIITLERQN